MYITIKEDSVYEEKKIFIPDIADSDSHTADAGNHAGGSQRAWNGKAVKHKSH